ncbi:subtilisin-like protease SBT1.8 [Phragmites australis]|uniref:subtilisin-like protease SBT1.8 n=1 Tax=Phragmites australis TaxID=29695 RepID=UPI002D76B4A4|nr:subtilisin-like protease SBT1.8 [Phragmites australis]
MLPMQQPLILFLLLFVVSTTYALASGADADAGAATYIVYLNPVLKPSHYATHLHWHHAHLDSLSLDPSRHLLYSYTTAAPSAFAARLLPSHVAALRSHPAVASVHEDVLLPLHTTRSPSFLHLPPYNGPEADGGGSDVIIGVLDTGVWPESPSFGDAVLGPVPSRWRGSCETNATDFPSSMCNRKLIGARAFFRGLSASGGNGSRISSDLMSPRDRDGHGTHTASTAAGAVVAKASLFGYASGTARGMVPGARVAAYKVCWRQGCFSSDILAGMEQAIDDGVDVLSLSLGGGAFPLSRDPIAIGALAATRRGIVVSCSAGNSGPSPSSLVNTAPWIITVGAGTLDRNFPAYAELGNGETHAGMSLYSGDGLGDDKFPMVYNKGIRAGSNASKLCMEGTLDAAVVKGKVVLCDRGGNSRVEKGQVVKQAGGVGMVLANTAQSGEEVVADSHLLPAVAVGAKSGDAIRRYVESDANAEVALTFAGTALDVRPAPVVAAFSSRGPNRQVPQLLKPDVIAPGVNILAGWTGSLGPTGLIADERRSPFNILSGTSMSCPHISGLAAFVKAAHPDWSPSAVKSALMTTAYTVDNTGSPLLDAATNATATPWSFGSGHVDPVRALSPGLVYDASVDDYVAFLCTVGVSPQQIQAITAAGPNVTCTRKLSSPGDLNYPSFSVVFARGSRSTVKYRRELTNVGDAGAEYTVKVTGPSDVSVSVKPARLLFRLAGGKLRYTVTFKSANARGPMDPAAFGWLTWSSDEHEVRSPISYSWGM